MLFKTLAARDVAAGASSPGAAVLDAEAADAARVAAEVAGARARQLKKTPPQLKPAVSLDQANICFHLQLALETRVRRLKKPHHDTDNGVRFLAYALLEAGGQRMRVTPQVLITHN